MQNFPDHNVRFTDRRATDLRCLTGRQRPLAARLGAVVLAGGLVLGLTACTSQSDSSVSSGADPGSTTSAESVTGTVTASDAWSRPTAVGQSVGSAYMTLTGGATDNSVVAATVPSDIAASVELHEVTMSTGDSDMDDMSDAMNDTSGDMDMDMDMGGMMRMQQVSSIAIPAGKTIMLEPGGYHLMLIGLAAPLTAGQTFNVTVELSGGETLVVPVTVRSS